MKLKIAIPSKGRISDPAVNILEKAGLGLKDASNRKLFSSTYNKDIDVMFARAADIPEFVDEGICDMGITGLDLIMEAEADVKILNDLKFGETKLVLASPENSEINSIKDLKDGMTVATEFPNLTEKYLKENGLNIKIVKLTGSTEIAPFIGVADAITDLTSTGTTLNMNHLKVVEVILESSIKLIANKNSYNEKNNLVESVSTSIKGVLEAERKKLVMMNVAKENLTEVQKVMPAMSGPTISEVLSKEEIMAVQAVVDEEEVFELINNLRNAGARDILVLPIERIIQ
ncbi:MAG: ATP phosphoribosyltransferase [Methanobacteriaceae archaeon]|nr:ATP phosphoribosyltransferase [Methanobacteriaceae archaeon]